MKTIKIGMLGIGNIGKGTYRTLEISGKDTLDRLCELILEEIHI